MRHDLYRLLAVDTGPNGTRLEIHTHTHTHTHARTPHTSNTIIEVQQASAADLK